MRLVLPHLIALAMLAAIGSEADARREPSAVRFLAAATSIPAPPDGFSDTLVTQVGGPTALAFTPDGRMLIATQPGRVFVFKEGVLLPTPALDLSARVCTQVERGLAGIAVDPLFVANRFIYVSYTFKRFGTCETGSSTNPVNRLSRFELSDSNVVDPASEVVLIDGIPSFTGSHNIGDVQFGNDGYLYVGVGEGHCDYAGDSGCSGANDAARDLHILLGKILRVTRDGEVPSTNPFLGPNSARCNVTGRTSPGSVCQETFSWGLRNPWRIALDPNASETRFLINDVGQNTWEEINLGEAGADYGWNVREGPCAMGSTTNCGPPPPGMTNPIYSYPHSSGCRAVTGGAFVPNGLWPVEYDGSYLYGDYVCGKVFKLVQTDGVFSATEFMTGFGASSVVTMKFGPAASGNALYYTTYANGGEVHRLDFTGAANRSPTAVASAAPTAGPLPLAVTFDASRSRDPDAGDTLTYLWDFGDGASPLETTDVVVGHPYTVAGTYFAELQVRDSGGALSQKVRIRIDPGNNPPSPTIDVPAEGARFRVGDPILLQGSASDPEDDALADSALTWSAVLVHNDHTHPFLQPTQGNRIPITAPAPEDLEATENSYLVVTLTATDSQGVQAVVTRELRPKLVDVTFDSDPPGVTIDVNATQLVTPRAVVSWEGYVLDVTAPSLIEQNGQTFVFQRWTDGETSPTRSITTPATTPAAYMLTYEPVTGVTQSFGVTAGGEDGDARSSSMNGSGAYPPDRPATTSTTSTQVLVRRAGPLFGGYEVRTGLLRFDSSLLPDGATITSAILRLHVTSATTANVRSLVAEWYNPALWPIDAGDYTVTAVSTAHPGTPIGSLTAGAEHDLPLQNLAQISTTGATALRLHIEGGQPTGENKVSFAAFEHATLPQAQLIVTYSAP